MGRHANYGILALGVVLSVAACAAPALAEDAPGRSPYGVLVRPPFPAAPTRAPAPARSPTPATAEGRLPPNDVVFASPAYPSTSRVAAARPAADAARPLALVSGGIEQVVFGPAVEGADHELRRPDATPPLAAPSPEEAARLKGLARRLLGSGSIAQARALLEPPADAGDAEARYLLAQTYDPEALARSGAVGVSGDPAGASALSDDARRGGYPGPGPQADASRP